MIKRFVIAAILVALFLGGVGYFNLVFKPAMIKDFVSKMAPPAAAVTAERAGTKEWVDRVKSIGTLMAIQGIDVAPEVGGIVKEYYFVHYKKSKAKSILKSIEGVVQMLP